MNRLLTALLLTISASAFADDGSAYFYQAPAGKHQLTTAIGYSLTSLKDDGNKVTENGPNAAARYEYGLNDMLALGLKLEWADINHSPEGGSDTHFVGMYDPKFLVIGTTPFQGAGILKYGATLAVSVPSDRNAQSSVGNNSGGLILTPYLGYEMNVAAEIFGAKLSQDINLAKRSYKFSSGTTKYTGGTETTFSLFYEHKLNEAERFGLALISTNIDKLKNDDTSSTTDFTSPLYTVAAYMQLNAGAGQFLPELSYTMTTEDTENGDTIKGYSDFKLLLGYRMTFN